MFQRDGVIVSAVDALITVCLVDALGVSGIQRWSSIKTYIRSESRGYSVVLELFL